ncbi:MAG: TetR/AcrR family transcriptional regulator [Deltaproteobacteria bacterium]|nr:TetR/AcrR family transcriptional regulator [Deltaproteobacteria bacterium]MBW1920873.1 TetR/AcrR family transcriptional regulator [Deltaproteobacteria bacterium]MBW1935549.1 TetR/AcrR family transcriptional regulator [Deltaproteobacteria bacterium]MBW1977260.1 TetR/AcrR family transcriptional regulator [Deltaproteobacteria bacterium]MBW2043848.1 TetR/AcrR family transcriptional regulator [Deltaproteobacteria bacterium]
MTVLTKKLTVLDQIASSDTVRRKIIDSASILYARKGYGATSIEEISEMAGVSLPVTYHYVKKKSEIMKMIMEDVLNTFRESLTKQIEGIEDPEEKLAVATVLYFRVVEQQSDKALLIYQKSSSLDKPARTRVMQLEVEVSEIFGKIIKEGIEKNAFKNVDVDLMAYNIIMMAHMWVLKKWHFKKRLTIDKYIDLQLPIILEALRK